MRLTTLLLVATLAIPVLAKAQNFEDRPRPRMMDVSTELKAMSLGSNTAFTITVEGADEKLAADIWKSYLKEFGAKTKKSKPEALKAEAVTINSIGGADPLFLYTDFSSRGTELKTFLWIAERGQFLGRNSNPRDVAAVENVLREYAILLRKAAIQRELDGEQKELDKMQRRLDLLARDIARSEREIENARLTIERAEASIEADRARTLEAQAELVKKQEELQAVADKLAAVGS